MSKKHYLGYHKPVRTELGVSRDLDGEVVITSAYSDFLVPAYRPRVPLVTDEPSLTVNGLADSVETMLRKVQMGLAETDRINLMSRARMSDPLTNQTAREALTKTINVIKDEMKNKQEEFNQKKQNREKQIDDAIKFMIEQQQQQQTAIVP